MTSPDSPVDTPEMLGLLSEEIAQTDMAIEQWRNESGGYFQLFDFRARVLRAIKQRLEAGEGTWADAVASKALNNELRARLTAAETRVRELTEIIAGAGVEFDDGRVGYVTIQIDRNDWLDARAAIRPPSALSESGIET